jgi:hypothetical protein
MHSMNRAPIPLSAAVIAGIALWLSRASFDVAGTTAAPVRVAMLPSMAELAGLLTLTLLVAAGIASLLRTKRTFWEPAADVLMPAYTLSLLVLPYLPWLADWLPALRLFAGPGRLIVWIVVAGQVLWILFPRLTPRAGLGLGSPFINRANAAALFGVMSVALSAPFVLNVRSAMATFSDLVNTIGRLPESTLSAVPAGALGVLFDQEYGVVAYAPVLLLGFIGLAGMLRDPSRRWVGAGLTVTALALILLPATVDPWWSRSMMPGRPVFLLLPLLGVPIAWLYGRLEPGSPARAGAQVLLLISVAITLTFVILTPRVPALQDGDGSSALLVWMSPTWQLWREAPTYVDGITRASAIRILLWLGGFTTVAWLLRRRHASSEGRAAMAAGLTAFAVFITLVTTSAAVVPDTARRFDVEGRVLFPLLETLDPIARPIAIRYDAFSLVGSEELPPLFQLSAVPDQRTDRQPLRVVLNARFRLPAGRYVLDLKGADAAGAMPNASMALQLGREGRPLETWPLALSRGQRVQHEFEVPLDAEFVGFRAARAVEGSIAELRVSPRDVVEARKRFPAGTVLSAAVFAPVRIFFHDSSAYPEADGFWVKGRTTVRMTMLKVRESDPGVQLAIHSGARPNVVTLVAPGWSKTLELVPGVTERVTVPSKEGERFIPLTVTSADGFVPAEIEQSRDRRLLGAWIAFIPDDIARTSATP